LDEASTTREMARLGLVSLAAGEAHRMELQFDGGLTGKSLDLRPELPVVFRW
jgi:hypothetical protein